MAKRYKSSYQAENDEARGANIERNGHKTPRRIKVEQQARSGKKKKADSKQYDYGDGYSYVPEKQKKKGGIITKILIVVFFGIFVVSGGMLVNELWVKPYFNDKDIGEIQEEMSIPTVDDEPQEETKEIEKPDGTKTIVKINDTVKSVNKLKLKYPDMAGWVKIPETDIHFPVMKPSPNDPEYYLYRNYKAENTEYGSIFLDEKSDIFSDNQILHGHSMLDERMFYGIIDYGKEDVYKKSPVINYDTHMEAGKWKIVSVFKTNTLESQGKFFDYFKSDFNSQEEKMDYIYNVMIRSIIYTGVDIKPDDRFITLSTCSYEIDGFRTAVVARKVRNGEDEAVDTSKFKLRGDKTLYPDGWYDNFGGSRPYYPETYAEAKSQGIIDWVE